MRGGPNILNDSCGVLVSPFKNHGISVQVFPTGETNPLVWFKGAHIFEV